MHGGSQGSTTTEDFTMDHLSSEELGIDDNGLENASLQAFWQEIASSNFIIENPRNNSHLSQSDTIQMQYGADEYEANVSIKKKASWNEAKLVEYEPGTNSFEEVYVVVNDEENKHSTPNKDSKRGEYEKHNLDVTVCHKIKQRRAKKVYGRSPKIAGVEDTKEAKFRSGRSAKDGGFLKSKTNVEILSSLATSCVTSFATIYVHLSISLTVGLLMLMPSVGVEGALTLLPANTLFVVGKTARMNCSTDLNRPVYWARTLVGSDVQQWLYYGKNGLDGNNADGRFTMDKDEATGRYDVIIEAVQPKDAGHYVCVDDSGFGTMASAELVVSDPINCKSHNPSDGVMGYNVFGIEQDLIQFSCSLTYTGNLSPSLEWRWPGSEVESDEPVVSVSTSSVISTLKLSPTKERDNVKFQCKANIESTAQNPVDNQLFWESETVNVGYAVFASKEVDTCPGVKWNLVCNPQCSYQFEKKENDCQCRYTYSDARTNKNYEVTSDAVNCGSDNDIPPTVTIVVISIVVALSAFTVAFVLIYCLTRKKTKWQRAARSEKPFVIRNGDNSSRDLL